MSDLSDLIATLRLAADVYAELASVEDALPETIDLEAEAAERSALATELEQASGTTGASVSRLAEELGDWREGTSAADLMQVIEKGIATLAERAYLAEAGSETKSVLERVDDAAAGVLARLGRRASAKPRATGDGDDRFALAVDDTQTGGDGDRRKPRQDDKRSGDEAADVFPVWFGTNRAPVDTKDVSKGFSGLRSTDGVRYGHCQVRIPKSHRLGSLGSGVLRRIFTGDDRLTIASHKPFAAAEFWKRVNAAANDEERGRHAVVFIHGYNVGFDEATLRAAQLGFDLGVNGPMSFFSWPSKGRLLGYFADGNSIEASSTDITDFLVSMANLPHIEQVHVIAHSMGNRGALAAVSAIAADAQRLSGRRFGQFVLAAADVDADVFRRGAPAYGHVGSGTTLYVSPNDRALQLSSRISDFARVGRSPPVSVVDGIDTVDVGKIDLGGLGHGYVAECRDVLVDIHALLSTGQRAANRFGLVAVPSEDGEFWQFKA